MPLGGLRFHVPKPAAGERSAAVQLPLTFPNGVVVARVRRVPTREACLVCHAPIPWRFGTGPQARFCSRRCRDRGRPIRATACAACSRSHLGTSAHRRGFCSKRCSTTWRAAHRINDNLSDPDKNRNCATCEKSFRLKHLRRKRRFCSRACMNAEATIICPECGDMTRRRLGARFCRRCARRSKNRASTIQRRARLRGVERSRVDPFVIFERDGWRCYLCGTEAPRHLRGQRHPWAPVVDHVIPLKAGGAHMPSNLRTAHRRCNGQKGAWVACDR